MDIRHPGHELTQANFQSLVDFGAAADRVRARLRAIGDGEPFHLRGTGRQ